MERKELNAKKIKDLKAKLRELKGEDTSESSEEEALGLPDVDEGEAAVAAALNPGRLDNLKAKFAKLRGEEVPDIPDADMSSEASNIEADEELERMM